MIRDTICILTLCFAVLCAVVVADDKSTPAGAKPEAQPPGVLRVQAEPDQLVEVRTRTRHTTVLVLPRGENILDFVVGDSDYWHLSGSANLAYLKPLDEKVQTNVALVCESGAIYSFLATEAPDPHLVVRIEAAHGAAPTAKPAFVARSAVDDYREMARAAGEAARAAREAADLRSTHAQSEAAETVNQFRADYPGRLSFAYQLDRKAREWPFLVDAMWHDGQFTYLRSRAQESPAIYELKDGKPSLVAYDLTPEGLYIARHVLGDGWLRIGRKRAQWRFDPARDFAPSPPEKIKRLLSGTKRTLEGITRGRSKEKPNE
jgi:type IV secretion system protein VirB9